MCNYGFLSFGLSKVSSFFSIGALGVILSNYSCFGSPSMYYSIDRSTVTSSRLSLTDDFLQLRRRSATRLLVPLIPHSTFSFDVLGRLSFHVLPCADCHTFLAQRVPLAPCTE
jgi:hypothetical protein